MNITTIGLDLAKNVFQIHAVDARGKVVVKKALKRSQVLSFFANLPPCLIGMEACASAHHWARKLSEFGHAVKLIAPQFVKPYVKTNKHDAADAEAICVEKHLKELDRQVREVEREIHLWHRENEASRRLAEVPGIGPLTASALVASIGDARSFENGRQLAAWLGLVPKQHMIWQDFSGHKIRQRFDAVARTRREFDNRASNVCAAGYKTLRCTRRFPAWPAPGSRNVDDGSTPS